MTGGFVQVVVGPPPAPAVAAIEVIVGEATIRIRPGFDAELLRSVVQVLSTGPVC
jgi:hypothetical protein